MSKLSIKDLELKGRKVLVRVDFNVPLDKKGHITDDTRIQAALPSIHYVLDHGGALILMAHLGRPKGQPSPELSLSRVVDHVSNLLGKPIILAKDCIGPDVVKQARELKPGQILLLENVRFHSAEEDPDSDPDFVRQLAALGDVYINDAFGSAHRAHASTATIAKYFPGKAAIGFLLENEITYLGDTLKNPKRPFYAIIGGAKVSSKLGIIKELIKKADALMIGGGMAYTFLKAKGYDIGDSIYEYDLLEMATIILEEAKIKNIPIILPMDHVIAQEASEEAKTTVCTNDEGIPEGYKGLDIGPKTIELFSKELQKAKTVFWNGPLGLFEVPSFARGTDAIAKVVAGLNAITIVGGGDSIAAIKGAGVEDQITHISTGGGATLEYIELGYLPGIEALSDKNY